MQSKIQITILTNALQISTLPFIQAKCKGVIMSLSIVSRSLGQPSSITLKIAKLFNIVYYFIGFNLFDLKSNLDRSTYLGNLAIIQTY